MLYFIETSKPNFPRHEIIPYRENKKIKPSDIIESLYSLSDISSPL